MTAISSTRQE